MKHFVLSAASALTLSACVTAPEGPTGVPLTGTCDASGYSAIVGLNLAAVTLPADLDQRVIYPGMSVTQEFRANRINIVVNEAGTIQRIYCG